MIAPCMSVCSDRCNGCSANPYSRKNNNNNNNNQINNNNNNNGASATEAAEPKHAVTVRVLKTPLPPPPSTSSSSSSSSSSNSSSSSSSTSSTSRLSAVPRYCNFEIMTGRRIVVMARHGESEWSKNNVFCGWYDSHLSDRGTNEAHECAELLKQSNYKFDKAYTSLLTRAHQTLKIITEHIDQPNLPVEESWRLNERHYGALTGFNKAELAKEYGEHQVQIWRRSFNVLPPEMDMSHKYYMSIWCHPKIMAHSDKTVHKFPSTESLKETMGRVIPYWDDFIVPSIKRGQRILIVAHGTVLRSLIKYLDGVSDNDICSINIPSGIPFVYEFDDEMKVVSSKQFLGDKKRIEEGIARAASIGSH